MQVDKVKAASSRRLHVSCSPLRGMYVPEAEREADHADVGGGAILPLLI